MKIDHVIKKQIYKNKFAIISFLIMAIILGLVSTITPYIFSEFMDNIVYEKSTNTIYRYSLILVVILFINIVFTYFNNILVTKLRWKLVYRLNEDVVCHIQRGEYKSINNYDLYYLNQRICMDCAEVIEFLISSIINCILNILIFLFSLFLLYRTSSIFFYMAIGLCIIYSILYLVIRKGLSERIYALKESQNKIFSSFLEQVVNIKQIKINSLEDIFIKRTFPKYEDTRRSLVRYTKFSYIIDGISTFFSSGFTILIILIGGYQIINGQLTFGGLMILNNYFSYSYSCISYFLGFSKMFQNFNVSRNRLEELYKIDEEKTQGESLEDINSISLKEVNFSYGNEFLYKDDKNMNFEKGNIYIIKGENGSGKTTFIDLLFGLYKPSKGHIEYNGVNIQSLNKSSLRALISYSPQDSFIFEGNCRENTLYEENISKYNENLSRLLSLEKFENENIVVSNNLSGGERQRVSLYRALNRDSKFLILDEPSNSLDKESVEFLKEYLLKIKEDKIIILITHDSSFNDMTQEEFKIKF